MEMKLVRQYRLTGEEPRPPMANQNENTSVLRHAPFIVTFNSLVNSLERPSSIGWTHVWRIGFIGTFQTRVEDERRTEWSRKSKHETETTDFFSNVSLERTFV